eukprot:scaffold101_cov373-Prasinococcus_capsulatus_cf.AAC.1
MGRCTGIVLRSGAPRAARERGAGDDAELRLTCARRQSHRGRPAADGPRSIGRCATTNHITHNRKERDGRCCGPGRHRRAGTSAGRAHPSLRPSPAPPLAKEPPPRRRARGGSRVVAAAPTPR